MNIFIRGKAVPIRFVHDLGVDEEGSTINGLWIPQKDGSSRLLIKRGLSLLDLVNVILHEMGHDFFPDATEEVIQQFGDDFSRTLVQLELIHDPRQQEDHHTTHLQ